MCGISGLMRFNRPASEEDGRIVKKMNERLFHRGPDAQDTQVFDRVALGFSRLSIIGLEDGMQPIRNEDGTVVLICNGEIFNYVELREQLKSKGHRFRTSSDVEVLIHLYEEYGMGFFDLINGQFAFVIYDSKVKTLFCARDHFGVIPFFYTIAGDSFIFGSEIKAILEHPAVVREVDLTGLDQVFTFAGLISPRTMFKGIYSLENGHYLRVGESGRMEDIEYWDLIYPEEGTLQDGRGEDYYTDRLEELLDESIRLRLRSDVPTGFYLSGGLDSSMIAMKINALAPGVNKEAFSIDFIESGISEAPYQKMIARECNARLNQKLFFYSDISDRLRHSIYHSECPLKETYNTASLSLSELVNEKGIKVILSGEGADEFFAGYVGFRFDKMRAMSAGMATANKAEEDLRERLWGDRGFFYEKNYLEFTTEKKALYSSDLVSGFAGIDCLNHPIVKRERLINRHVVDKRAYADYKLRLVDHLVSDHGDRMALANAVEVRYPFMDKDLVEFSTRIPPGLKLNEFTEKYILRKIAARVMPAPVAQREKFGFVAPGSPYLLQKNIEYIRDILSPAQIRRQGYFNPETVEALTKTYSREGFSLNIPFENDLLITVITFGIFLDKYFHS